jgi:diacylglycerol kinase
LTPNERRTELIASFRYAFGGLWQVVRTQRNARIHLCIAALVIAVGIVLRLAVVEWAVLALTVGLVLATEAFNSAVESVVDLVTLEDHPLAKGAKDMAAAAVLVAAMAAVAIGVLILGVPAWQRLSALLR